MKDVEKMNPEKNLGEFEKYTKEDIPLLLTCKEKAQNDLKKIGINEISKIEKIDKMSISKLMKKCSITNEVADRIKRAAHFYLFSHVLLTFLSKCEADEVRVYEDGSVACMGTVVSEQNLSKKDM